MSLTCVLALGLGIGATTAIFAFIDKLLLEPFDFPQDGLAMALESSPGRERQPVPAAFAETWAETATSFSSVASYEWWEVNLTGVNEPEHLVGYRVSPGFFSTLGVKPVLGRGFNVEEARPGAEDVVVLSEGLWRRRFAADPSILGRRVLLDGVGHTVIGVMPGSFRFPKAAGLWAPRRVTDADRQGVGSHSVFVVGRLAPGKGLAGAGDELAAISRTFDAGHPAHEPGHRPQVFSLREYGDPTTRTVLWIMAAAVGMMLVLACANVANVLLARATVRSREFALRIALGAPRSSIVLQLVSEGLLLAVGACLVGLALARSGSACFASESRRTSSDSSPDGTASASTGGSSVSPSRCRCWPRSPRRATPRSRPPATPRPGRSSPRTFARAVAGPGTAAAACWSWCRWRWRWSW